MPYNNRFFSFFGLKYNPFEKNNSDLYRFDSTDVKELNIRLDHLISIKGIVLSLVDLVLAKLLLLEIMSLNLINLYLKLFIFLIQL